MRFYVFCTLQAYLDIGGTYMLKKQVATTRKGDVYLAELCYKRMRGYALVRMLTDTVGQIGDFISYGDVSEEQTDILYDTVYQDLTRASASIGKWRTKAIKMDFWANMLLLIRMFFILYGAYVCAKMFYVFSVPLLIKFLMAVVVVFVLNRLNDNIMEGYRLI